GPNANAGSNKTIICGGSTSIGGAPTGSGGTGPYTYSWSPIAGLNDPTIPNPISSPSSSTTYTVTVTDNYGCSTSSAPVTVTINYNLVANVGSNKTIPCGGSTLIGGSPTGLGGASPLTYSWSPQAGLNDPTDPNPIASPSVTTSYTVTVMDNNGCSTSSNPVTVTINYNLLADAGQDKTIPCGGSTSIGGSPAATGGNTPYSYLWSPAAGLNNNTLSNPTASPAFTTTYILTVTDNNSCDHIDSMKVIVNPGPTADAGSNKTIACGGTTTIGGAPTGLGGISPYTYAWSPPSGLSNTAVGNPTVSMNTTTTYTVIVTDDNGCSDTSSITVLVNPGPTAEAGLDKTIGCGNSTIIGGSSTGSAGTSPYTYLWAPSGDLNSSTIANPTANPISNTTYTVIVTDDNNCTGTDTMNVQVTNLNGPFASITKTDANCGNADGTATATTSSGVPPYTYMWSTGKTTDSITNLLPGTYSVTVTDSIGCTDTASVVIYNIGNFTAQVTNSNPVICAGEITTLVASGAVTYSWYPTTGLDTSKGPVVNASPSITTTYTLVAFSGNCIDSVNVPVIVNPLPQPVISGKPAVCLNEKDAFYSTPYANNHAYSWTVTNGSIVLGQYTDKIEVNWSSAGSGSVQVEESINSTGCKVVTPVFNVLIQSYPAPGKSTFTLKGNNILVCSDTSVSSYQWYYNGNKIAGATKQFYVANPFYPSGPYWVITATSNGCETRSNVYPVNNTGINEIDNVSQIVIYPNPNSQNFNVYIDNNIYGEVEILIKDYTGREFSRIRFDKTGKSIVKNISTNTLASGIYLVEIIFPDRTKYYRRMIVIN
ncbi:MAG: T9SS type A sorting domain-containing protein, partial [Bacteroidetes bacterium]|nr:T9SS type A sorting domain-containing protein [Bacteroidota bacterium]